MRERVQLGESGEGMGKEEGLEGNGEKDGKCYMTKK